MKAFTLPSDWKQSAALAGLTTVDRLGSWSADVPLRVFLAWEFFESGLEKFNGSNWFADLQSSFPFPFNLLPAELNWQLSMWAELVLPLLLLLGLGTGWHRWV